MIYSLKLIKMKILKIYFKISLVNKFIKLLYNKLILIFYIKNQILLILNLLIKL